MMTTKINQIIDLALRLPINECITPPSTRRPVRVVVDVVVWVAPRPPSVFV